MGARPFPYTADPPGRAGGLKLLEPLKSDSAWGHRNCGLLIAECGLKKQKSEIRNPKFKRPMLFAQKLLAPGPQPKLHGNVKLRE
jgi:hypothetical protein